MASVARRVFICGPMVRASVSMPGVVVLDVDAVLIAGVAGGLSGRIGCGAQPGGAGEFGLTLVESEEGIGAEDEGGGDVEDVERARGVATEVMRDKAVRLRGKAGGRGFPCG